MAKKRSWEHRLASEDAAEEPPSASEPRVEVSGVPAPLVSGIRPPRPTAAARVLVVDDDPLVLGMIERSLRRHGFSVLTAVDGPTALRIYREEREAIDLVVLDVTMPDMDGIATCHALYALDPTLRVIFTSGYDASATESSDLPDCVRAFVQKPFRPSDLAELMHGVIDEKADKPK